MPKKIAPSRKDEFISVTANDGITHNGIPTNAAWAKDQIEDLQRIIKGSKNPAMKNIYDSRMSVLIDVK